MYCRKNSKRPHIDDCFLKCCINNKYLHWKKNFLKFRSEFADVIRSRDLRSEIPPLSPYTTVFTIKDIRCLMVNIVAFESDLPLTVVGSYPARDIEIFHVTKLSSS